MIIRRIPEDFAVEEVLAASFSSSPAAHAAYAVTKTSLSTPQAAAMLSRALGVRAGQVAWAGLKDKHARTRQHMTCPWRKDQPPPRSFAERGIAAEFVGWADTPIDASAIAENRFDIVVRDARTEDLAEMDRRVNRLADASGLLLVNYFGAQRFGSARHGEGWIARHLIRGEFEHALKLAIGTPDRKDSGPRRAMTRALATHWGNWSAALPLVPRCPERRAVEVLAQGSDFRDAFTQLPHQFQQLCIEAYQSHLWNAAARCIAEMLAPGTCLVGDDDFGPMFFPPAQVVPSLWRDVNMPMLAGSSTLTEPWASAAQSALTREGLTVRDLSIKGMRKPNFGEAPRNLFIRATNLRMDPPQPDDLSDRKRLKRTIRFTLPRGSYATVVLRALGQ
ncbi:MAG: tRNA pseudouridine(13) synthase TruD [Planctomycetes bacterium]|nr:tRNA pseudouridine(13) synthase TruD [Planctomycetota bacterium]